MRLIFTDLLITFTLIRSGFERIYGHTLHPVAVKGEGRKIIVWVISQFGEENTKVAGGLRYLPNLLLAE